MVSVAASMAVPLVAGLEREALDDQLDSLGLQGRSVLIVEPSRPGSTATIDRASCDAVSKGSDVERSGLIEPGGEVTAPQLGTRVPVLLASTTLFPSAADHDVLVGSSLALSAKGGDRRLLIDGAVLGSGRAEPQPEGIRTNQSLVAPLGASVREGQTCVVVLDRLADSAAVGPRLIAELSATGPIRAAPVLVETTPVVESFLARPTRYLPVALAVVGALVAGLAARSRRREFAAYRLSGTSARELMLLVVLEQLLVVGLATILGLLALLALAGAHPLAAAPALMSVVAQSSLWLVLATAAVLPTALSNPALLTRES